MRCNGFVCKTKCKKPLFENYIIMSNIFICLLTKVTFNCVVQVKQIKQRIGQTPTGHFIMLYTKKPTGHLKKIQLCL